jgi:hypothetical protein
LERVTDMARLKPLQQIGYYILYLLTWTYHGALQHYTIEPIHELALHQHDLWQLRQLLVNFRLRKEQEIEFVKKAVLQSLYIFISIYSLL